MGIFKVAWNETLEALLPSSIPQLKTDHFASSGDVFTNEVDTDGWLFQCTGTFLVGSNSFRMYLAMIELLPTFWSPTRTILNF